VTKWIGEEMAFREVGSSGEPEFSSPEIPFLQLGVLDMLLESGRVQRVNTYQNDDSWGLAVEEVDTPMELMPRETGSIYRTRILSELPLGVVLEAAVELDEIGDVRAVWLTFDRNRVELTAGEVYESPEGTLQIVEPDESVFIRVHDR
jgi:hypothetical protein